MKKKNTVSESKYKDWEKISALYYTRLLEQYYSSSDESKQQINNIVHIYKNLSANFETFLYKGVAPAIGIPYKEISTKNWSKDELAELPHDPFVDLRYTLISILLDILDFYEPSNIKYDTQGLYREEYFGVKKEYIPFKDLWEIMKNYKQDREQFRIDDILEEASKLTDKQIDDLYWTQRLMHKNKLSYSNDIDLNKDYYHNIIDYVEKEFKSLHGDKKAQINYLTGKLFFYDVDLKNFKGERIETNKIFEDIRERIESSDNLSFWTSFGWLNVYGS